MLRLTTFSKCSLSSPVASRIGDLSANTDGDLNDWLSRRFCYRTEDQAFRCL
jgi:hypothetical protein